MQSKLSQFCFYYELLKVRKHWKLPHGMRLIQLSSSFVSSDQAPYIKKKRNDAESMSLSKNSIQARKTEPTMAELFGSAKRFGRLLGFHPLVGLRPNPFYILLPNGRSK